MPGNVIDSFLIALGVTVDKAGFQGVKRQVDEAKESVLSLGTAFKAFVAGFAIKEVADIGSTFEQNQIQIAGFLSALGQSSDFNAGLEDAQGVIAQITKDAAKLPGEAQEYIDVFKAGLPFVQGAMPGGSLNQITDFTNRLTAIGKTFGLGSDVIAREFDHMLSPGKGMASLRLPLFRQLLAFMPKLANGAAVTAESFNAMTAPQRLQLLQDTFVKLQPMLDASANSFDAMWGAAVSAIKQITRLATAPLFKAMKQGLDALNATFYDSDGQLTEFGKNFVDTAKTIVGWIGQILSMGGAFVSWLVHSKVGMVGLKIAAVAVGLALAGMAIESTISMVAKLVKGVSNLKRALMGGLFIALVLIAEDIYTFTQGGDSLTGMLMQKFAPAIETVTQLLRDLRDGVMDVVGLFKVFKFQTDETGASLDGISDDMSTAAEIIIGASAAIAIALAAAFAPITTAVVAVAALITMVKQLKNHKGFFNDRVNAIGKSIAGGLGAGVYNTQMDMGGAGVLSAPPPTSPWELPSAAPWASAPSGIAPGTGPVSGSQVTIGEINIHSTDPKEAARETAREITRNAQKGYR